ncbi:hypothetical protein [Streptomyces sp. NPDC017991]|uniref:hypothetical protein n=1 Tax=Streptomyces sp. NPDC017991 TaxID=3365026 RepID=UPI0037AE39FE
MVNGSETSGRLRCFFALYRIRTRVASSLVLLLGAGTLWMVAVLHFGADEAAETTVSLLPMYLLVHYMVWRFRLSPGVGAGPDGLVVRNEYLEHRIPWSEVSHVAWGRGIEGRILRVRANGVTVGSAAFRGVVVPEAERRRILAFIEEARRSPSAGNGTYRVRTVFGPAEVVCLVGFVSALIVATN